MDKHADEYTQQITDRENATEEQDIDSIAYQASPLQQNDNDDPREQENSNQNERKRQSHQTDGSIAKKKRTGSALPLICFSFCELNLRNVPRSPKKDISCCKRIYGHCRWQTVAYDITGYNLGKLSVRSSGFMGIVVGRPSRTILLDRTGEENWNSMLATDDTPVIIRSYGLRRRRKTGEENWNSMLATDDTPVIIRSYGLRRRRNWSIFRNNSIGSLLNELAYCSKLVVRQFAKRARVLFQVSGINSLDYFGK
ncbi:hypothetical protein QE152_g937 [Popillia japonica]|uniref:Uncharacterized protein n=1 Tax=Popillia japonica TaxID=7064 RepID=A0AAW1NE07_POPJA